MIGIIMSGETAVASGLAKTKTALLDWGVPAVAVITGIILGDVIQVGKFLNDLIPVKMGEKAMGIIVAAAYAVGGALIWSHFGMIGHFIGGLLFGMAIGSVYLALTGKALVIPGFGG